MNYNDSELLGFGSPDQMVQALAADPNAATAVRNRLKNQSLVAARCSRLAALAQLGQLPKEIQDGLAQKAYRLVDDEIYSVRNVSGSKTAKFFLPADLENLGERNLNAGRLPKGSFFLVYAMRILFADLGATPPILGDIASWGAIPAFMRNGEIEVVQVNKALIDGASLEMFDTSNDTTVKTGLKVLDNPFWIGDTSLEVNAEWTTAAPADSFLKLNLIGSVVRPA